jgi:hypothetical protein
MEKIYQNISLREELCTLRNLVMEGAKAQKTKNNVLFFICGL